MTLRPVLMLGIGLSLAMAAGCVKKGSGEGKRATRPFFEDQGSIKNDGKANQKPTSDDPKVPKKPDPDSPVKPKPMPTEPVMDPDVTAILAACMKIPAKEVQAVVGWTDKAKSVEAANALCAKLSLVKYGDGVNPTAEAVAVE